MKKSDTKNPTFLESFRSDCPVAGLLDIVGDKWTLVVIRDLFMGKRRYGEFLTSPEAIPTNILAERLKRLETAGLVVKERYQDNPPRAEYFLTRRGADLAPVLSAMRDWGGKYIPNTKVQKKIATIEIKD